MNLFARILTTVLLSLRCGVCLDHSSQRDRAASLCTQNTEGCVVPRLPATAVFTADWPPRPPELFIHDMLGPRTRSAAQRASRAEEAERDGDGNANGDEREQNKLSAAAAAPAASKLYAHFDH